MTQTTTITETDIFDAPNDCFRSGTSDSASYIFDSQIDTAKKIISSFLDMTTRRNHVILLAKMQSGKTGVCNATVNIVNNFEGLRSQMGINKFFFITGMNDCGLKAQTYERLNLQVQDACRSNIYDGRRAKKYRGEKKYFVLKNSDLLAYDGSIDNSLIFIDECHYGSGKKNKLTQFLEKNGIDWKNRDELISRNIYIVSVSATPFSELISDYGEYKTCVELETNDNYIGVSDFIEQGLVHQAKAYGSRTEEIGDILDALLEGLTRMKQDKQMGICIVRTRKYDALQQRDFIKNFEVYEMDASASKIDYDRLTYKMKALVAANNFNKRFEGMNENSIIVKTQKIDVKPLLVLIKGAFRAGVTIDAEIKNYIYMVYDYSVKSAATAQALLGRICGYRQGDNVKNPLFYVNASLARMYGDWEQDFSNRDLIPTDKVEQEWVADSDKLSDQTILSSKSCGNFTIPLSKTEVENIYKKCKSKKTGRANAKILFANLLEERGIDCEYDYFHEAHMQGKNNYAESSQQKRFDAFTKDSLVFGFRADKMTDFIDDTGRNYLTNEDFGKKSISIVLDAEIDKDSGKCIGGNMRLLVYYCEVGAFRIVPNKKSMYKEHMDTSKL